MINYDSLYGIHIEFTSRCNLKCPQCARVKDGNLNPYMPLEDLDIKVFEKLLAETENKIEYLHICGNYGDFLSYPKLEEALALINRYKIPFTKIYTNGSARNKQFWTNLGKTLQGQVVFSIDGLNSENAVYRVGSNFDKIIDNAEDFIASGGAAVWEFLPFEHNEHQVEDAINYAQSVGFSEFILKRNPRFSPLNNGEGVSIKPSKKYVHHGIKKQEQMIMGETQSLTPTMFPISCKYQKRKMVFIDFQGNVLPCCWHGNRFNADAKDGKNEFQKIIEGYPENYFNLSVYTLKEILSNDWYKKDMEYSTKVLKTCRKHCSLGNKMSNNENREVYKFQEIVDKEPWE